LAKTTHIVGFNQPERRNVVVDILHRVGIKAPLNEVYQALATREGAAAWWTTNTQGRSEVGGLLKFRFSSEGKEIGGFDMKVLELQSGKRVLWQVLEGPAEWIGTKISFDLKQEGDYSIVLFSHQGWMRIPAIVDSDSRPSWTGPGSRRRPPPILAGCPF
jgi:uncharacterized protein YndB with AHSA1/START domain